jgi:hypothetical protein
MFPGLSELAKVTMPFVEARRKESGGYGATPMLPATVEDTYYALRILSALKPRDSHCYTQDRALKNYLSGMKETEWTGARTTFHFLSACIMTKIPVDTDRTILFVKRRLAKTRDLDERYYCTRIVREIPGPWHGLGTEQAAEDFVKLNWRDATELWMNIYQLYGSQKDQKIPVRNDLVAWLQSCQNRDGGFGFLPGTTSFIENCYSCLRALFLLEAVPLNPKGCQSFLMSCWTGTGGFARANRAMAFLYSTWYGIAAFLLLDITVKQ